MKKQLLLVLCALLLTACADKNQYEQAVLAKMEKEQDVKDYKIAPEDMTKCVIAQTSEKMPGIFALDPERLTAYRNYAKMLNADTAKDPKAELDQLRQDFGSPQALAEAHRNYTESVVDCYSVAVSKTEDSEKNK
jgi:hypothetical protein